MKSAHTKPPIRRTTARPSRPVSRQALGVAAGLVATLLLLAALTLVHGPAASGLGITDPGPAELPEADAWLATYSPCDAPAPTMLVASGRSATMARGPVILAKDAVLKLPDAPLELRKLINEVAAEVKIPPALLHAVIATESRYNGDALSPRGAVGLMQLMPETALRFGAPDPYNQRDNVLAGANYLKFLLKLFDNNMELALAGYNAGHGAVMRAGNRIPAYPETMAYVPKVLAYMRCASSAACRPS
ncbi:MAG: lytic transglycosylase domain-containing protein [Burkholderiaceae bacterium]